MAAPSLERLAEFVNITDPPTIQRLQEFLDASLLTITQRCGPPAGTVVAEQVHARDGVLVLSERPVQELVTVMDDRGGEVSIEGARISRRSAVVRLSRPMTCEFDVTYKAGWDPYPADLEMAVYIVADHLWETQRGRSGSFAALHGLDDDAPVGGDASHFVLRGFALPRRAMELTRPYIKPGFA